LFQKRIQYLRHIILLEGVTVNPEKLKTLWECPLLKDKLRSFFRLYTYYWRFIADCVDNTKPLMLLTEQEWAFQWSLQAEAAFWSLKKLLCMTPIL
jgi:hypothetical protein